ncbi:MAG: hypothetical protein EKK41_29280 [Hyphomicrobiales bacterium]|nr:MAG: hypothetical protein EKK41_29280 [Hyphomicrobiales bacterium]
MRRLRVIDTGLASGRRNTALSAGLLMAHAGSDTDVLRFYRFEPSVLLGASQIAAQAANLAHCRDAGIEIARRVTGGGAVYMGPGMLAWDFVTRSSAAPDTLSVKIGDVLVQALAKLGIEARFAPPNSLMIKGRKISGAATTSTAGSFLLQGTLILEDAATDMAHALGAPPQAMRAAVTSLAEVGAQVSSEALQSAIAHALAQAFDLVPIASSLTEHERAIAEREFDAEIGSDANALGEDLLLNAGARA